MNNRNSVGEHIRKYAVTYLFIIISVFFIAVSGVDTTYVSSELIKRITRNAFIVLALIIPVVAGMGINFAITIGAMAAQIGVLLVVSWNMQGPVSALTAAAVALPLAMLFGLLIGRLLNKMKGQETIGSMILGFFANGLYQLLFKFIFGNIIKLNKNVIINSNNSSGVKNTIDLKVGYLGRSVDDIWRIDFIAVVYIICAVMLLYGVYKLVRAFVTAGKDEHTRGMKPMALIREKHLGKMIVVIASAVVIAALITVPAVAHVFDGTNNNATGAATTVPVVTWLLIFLLCGFNVIIMKTRLGQKFRAVGQNRVVANASGINVDRVRVIAIMLSTVLAAFGQIIFLQSDGMCVMASYAAHEQVGLYAGAAILVGGASIDRATNGQALLGTFLFHLVFITVQNAMAKLLPNNTDITEYLRAFLSYGVIAVALVLYAWKGSKKRKQPDAELRDATEKIEKKLGK